jgi:hypothetical protein
MSTENQEHHQQPHDGGVSAPPRWLLWGVIGLFVLAIVGGVAGIWIFRDVLRPSQQQRVMDMFPFMHAFMRGGEAIPTPELQITSTISAGSLLDMGPIVVSTSTPTATEIVEATATMEVTVEATVEAAVAATIPPTIAVSPTPEPTVAVNLPTPTPTTIEVTQVSSGQTLPPANRIYGITHIQQDWNNCGPANITMALSYYGWTEDISVAASYLKTDREDKNVSPSELVSFVDEETGIRAITRIGGDLGILRALLAANFPVIIETGYMFEGYDWIGHYRTLVAYDDNLQLFYIYDSFLGDGTSGEGITESYDELDEHWRAFNRTFIVLYERERENEVAQIIGNLADPQLAAQHALEVAQQEARENPQDSFAWFNMGTAFTRLGQYEDAATAYDQARRVQFPVLPWRMLWYQFGMYEAYFNVGRYEDVLSIVEYNLNNGGQYVEETFYWQGRVYAAQGLNSEAASSFRRAIAQNSHFEAAREALNSVSS